MALLVVVSLLSLLAIFVSADGIYKKNSPVLQVTSRTYDSLIAQSNHTSILEFYAPWCGHCQNLKPAYEKAAQNLAGLAKVAAINCDEESNKPFCGQMGVQGFPTLKLIKPGSKPGRPIVEDYQGARTAKGIVDAVVDKIPNHVKRVQGDQLDNWLAENPEAPKAILYTEKGTTSALIRSLAVDYLGIIDFAQVKSKETSATERYGVTQFPTLVVLPGQGKAPLLYTDEMKKPAMVAFISQIAAPNPDPALKPAQSSKAPKGSKSTASSKLSKVSAAHKSADLYEDVIDAGTVILDGTLPTDSPLPIVPLKETPIAIPEVVPAIPILVTAEELEAACLSAKSGTCILVLLPAKGPENALPQGATDALASLAELADKHAHRKSSLFPFYGVPAENIAAKVLRDELGVAVESQLEVLAINMKRGWYLVYPGGEYDVSVIEAFVDGIRFGESSRQKFPEGFYATAKPTEQQPLEAEPVQEPIVSATIPEESIEAADPEHASSVEHGEL